jgi:recombinational DNA repair ATPase RecF
MLRLKQLKIKNCRGIRDGPNLAFEAGGMLLCGDNGTGKSSYIDALEKVLTGKCSALDAGIQGISWKKQGAHIRSKGDPEIQLIITDGKSDYLVNDEQDPKKYPNVLKKFLDSAQIRPFILHRKTLLDFVDAKPGERYKAIEEFLRLDEFKEFEKNLKELLADCNAKYSDAQNRMGENTRALKLRLNLSSDSSVDVNTCISQINLQLFPLGIPNLSDLEEVPDRLIKIEECIAPLKHDENLQVWTNLSIILGEVQKSEVLDAAGGNYSESRKKLLIKQAGIKGHFYAEILENGLKWIQEDTLNNCPLCGSTINPEEVAHYVEKRIKENEEIISLSEDQNQKFKIFVSILSTNKNTLTKFKSLLPVMFDEDLVKKLDLIIAKYNILEQANKDLQSPERILNDLVDLNTQNTDEVILEIKQKITTICSQFSDHERYGNLFSAKISLESLVTHQKNIAACHRELAHYDDSSKQIQILVKYAEQARKNTVQNLMDTIGGLADTFFQKIHPDETIGKPQLTITERGVGSIKLTSTFYGEEDDPRGHYSEGHIDTLGLCLFLAICRAQHQQNPDFSLLILDDVLHSVDGNHRRRTAELIFKEFSDHQIIITTHDRMWFEIIKMVSRSDGNSKKFKAYQIAGWTLEDGPVLGDHLSDYEWLMSEEGKKAQPSDRVNKSGRLLEEILQNLCDSLAISVPFRMRGDYTIDPLWTSFYSRAKKQLEFYEKTKLCLESVEKLRQQRNWVGAHYNEWAKTLTADESKDFATCVINLRNFVYCETCNQFISRIPQLDDLWSCKSQHLKYKRV